MQACTTYGPRAKCGPRKLLIWPAKPQIVFNLSTLALGYVAKNFLARHEIWVVHTWSNESPNKDPMVKEIGEILRILMFWMILDLYMI